MRIALFTDTYLPEVNGVTNTLSKLGNYLDKLNIQQLLIAPDYEKNNLDCCSIYRKVCRFKGISAPISPNSRLAIPAYWDIDKICDKFMPDIIHVTTELGIGFRGMRYALSRNIPLVMSYHTDYCKYLKYHNLDIFRPLLDSYLSWFHNLSCRTLVPSQHTFFELSQKGYRNLDIWSRGIDSKNFSPEFRNDNLRKTLAKGKFIFLYVGRLSAEKSLDILLNAAGEIEKRFPGKTAFVFTGDGPYVKVIKDSNLPNLILTGFMKNRELSEMYASADCFAFPSATETFGNVILEALSSGLPVVATTGGGITDLLSHNYNALLCAPDNTNIFTNNLINVMEDKTLRLNLSANALKSISHRDWNYIFNGLVNTYNTAIKEYSKQNMPLSA